METDLDALFQMERCVDGPGWRWAVAQREAARASAGPLSEADDIVARARDYLRLAGRGEFAARRAAQQHPEIQAAVSLWQDQTLRARMKVLTVGGCVAPEIAQQLGVDEETIAIAEALFFDVRPALEARGWVVGAVIRPEELAGNVDLVTRLRLAYFGGRLVARAILDASERLPFAKAQQLFDQSILVQMKVQEALSMPLGNGRDALEFVKAYFEYRLEDKKLDLETEKFRYQCEHEIGRQRLAEQQATTADNPKEACAAQQRQAGTKAA